jgi:VanZ family protein
LFRAFRKQLEGSGGLRWAGIPMLIIVLFATGDELHQFFTGTRTAALTDVLLDAAAGLLAQLICLKRFEIGKDIPDRV